MAETSGMHIVQLTAENVKRLHAVCIRPDGNLVQITGRNGEGKSSVLDSIMYAIGGKRARPGEPVRKGAKQARVEVDLGDKVIRWQQSKKGIDSLIVESKDGSRYPSPQAVLDSLVGDLTFDPLAFARMAAKDQLAVLKRVAGLDFAEIDTERARLFAQRSNVNRTLRDIRGSLAAMPEVDAPDAEVDVAALSAELDTAYKERQAWGATQAEHETAKAEEKRIHDESREQIAVIERRMSQATERMIAAREAITRLADPPDCDTIRVQIAAAQETNQAVRDKRERDQAVANEKDHAERADALTRKIGKIDEDKAAQVGAAKLPIEELGFDDDAVTLQGLPFEQAASSEQLRASVAMGIAINPELRVMLIRDGSLLDSENLTLLGAMAEEHDVQIWVERATDGEPIGVVIEDGYASGDEAMAVEE